MLTRGCCAPFLFKSCGLLLFLFRFAVPLALSEESHDPVRAYLTPEERRELGQSHELWDWLRVGGLLELDYSYHDYSLSETSNKSTHDETSETLQLGAELEPLPWLQGTVVYEYDVERDEHELDELFASFDAYDFTIEVGRLYPPFGEYYSQFVTGPVLEFGETRALSGMLTYEPLDAMAVTAFLYDGRTKAAVDGATRPGWGFSFEVGLNEKLSVEAGFISNIADSGENFLEDHEYRYERRVPAVNGGVSYDADDLAVTLEYLAALRRFEELESDRDRPVGYNLEFAVYPHDHVSVAFRFEGSEEVEDAPKYRGGVATSYSICKHAFLTIEYLYESYESGLAEDSSGDTLDNSHLLVAELAFPL